VVSVPQPTGCTWYSSPLRFNGNFLTEEPIYDTRVLFDCTCVSVSWKGEYFESRYAKACLWMFELKVSF